MKNYSKGSASVVALVIALVVIAAGAAFYAGTTSSTPAHTASSITGPDSSNPYFGVNGVQTYETNVRMRNATTTICAIKSPSATSTLQFASWQIGLGTSTAATIDLATSTNPYSTTTPALVVGTSVASGAQASVSWDPAGTNGTLAPNTYVIAKTAGVGLGGYTYGGDCEATFTVL